MKISDEHDLFVGQTQSVCHFFGLIETGWDIAVTAIFHQKPNFKIAPCLGNYVITDENHPVSSTVVNEYFTTVMMSFREAVRYR